MIFDTLGGLQERAGVSDPRRHVQHVRVRTGHARLLLVTGRISE